MIGAGYVGLVSTAPVCRLRTRRVLRRQGSAQDRGAEPRRDPIFEPGLSDLVAKNVREGGSPATDLTDAVQAAEAVFIAVGTPSRRGDGHADLSYVYQAAREIAAALNGYTVIVTKSTVPVGTGDEVERIVRETRPDAQFAVVSNPEFLREGAAITDFKRPDRIVIGTEDDRAAAAMQEIYRPLYLNQAPILVTSRRSAELTKYAANAFLATKITFINEIADLSEQVGANVQDVARGIGLDNRIGSKFLHAGPGYGGSCFPKDTGADQDRTGLQRPGPYRRDRGRGQRSAQARHGAQGRGGLRRLGARQDDRGARAHLQAQHRQRDAPAITVIAALQDAGAKVRAFDPEGVEQAKSVLTDVEYAPDAYACAQGAHALVIITEWDIFRALDLGRLKAASRRRCSSTCATSTAPRR